MATAFVFLFPGQGAQYIGMGKGFFDAFSSVQQMFQQASEVSGRDFKHLCFNGPEATLVGTDNAQPAVTLVNLACLQVLREEGLSPSAVSGHSLGEYSALCAAGVLSFADTIRLVDIRGKAMKEAAERHPGGMTAVFGLDKESLLTICEEVRNIGSVEVANYNSPLQVVLTGEREALQKASDLAKQKGAKLCVPLKVSGPWHSRFMAEAKERMKEVLQECPVACPSFPVISNLTGDVYPDDAEKIRKNLVEQMVSPVLWSSSISRLIQNGHRLFIEVGPGKVLTGLMKDINRDAKIMNVQDLDTLEKFRLFRAESISH